MAKSTKTAGNRKTATKGRTNKGDWMNEEYVDTEGMELTDPDAKLTAKQQAAKDKAEVQARKRAEREARTNYTGAPIPASKVYRREMPEFKNCRAEMLMLVNENAGTTTFANTYNGFLKASYKPETYTYKTNEKKHAAKVEQMIEVEVADWPEWIVNAAGTKAEKRVRKAK